VRRLTATTFSLAAPWQPAACQVEAVHSGNGKTRGRVGYEIFREITFFFWIDTKRIILFLMDHQTRADQNQ
jgi:hypothetical protein